MDTESIEKFLRETRTAGGQTPLKNAQVNAVIDRVWASQSYPEDGGPRANPDCDPADYADYGFSIFPAQGDLIYLLCRAMWTFAKAMVARRSRILAAPLISRSSMVGR